MREFDKREREWYIIHNMSFWTLESSTIKDGISESIERAWGSIKEVRNHNWWVSDIVFHSHRWWNGYIRVNGDSYSVFLYSNNAWENRGENLNIQALESTLKSLISPSFELTKLIIATRQRQQQVMDDTRVRDLKGQLRGERLRNRDLDWVNTGLRSELRIAQERIQRLEAQLHVQSKAVAPQQPSPALPLAQAKEFHPPVIEVPKALALPHPETVVSAKINPYHALYLPEWDEKLPEHPVVCNWVMNINLTSIWFHCFSIKGNTIRMLCGQWYDYTIKNSDKFISDWKHTLLTHQACGADVLEPMNEVYHLLKNVEKWTVIPTYITIERISLEGLPSKFYKIGIYHFAHETNGARNWAYIGVSFLSDWTGFNTMDVLKSLRTVLNMVYFWVPEGKRNDNSLLVSLAKPEYSSPALIALRDKELIEAIPNPRMHNDSKEQQRELTDDDFFDLAQTLEWYAKLKNWKSGYYGELQPWFIDETFYKSLSK